MDKIKSKKATKLFFIAALLAILALAVNYAPIISFGSSSESASTLIHHSANYGISRTMKNIPLFYLSSGQPTPKNLRPLIAYIDINGSPRDWNYDGLIFIDNRLVKTNNPDQSTCDRFIYDLFERGGLNTLDQTVGTLKYQRSDPDYKFNIIIQIPYWTDSTNAKGNVLKILDKWNNSKYQNLTLAGFYWGFVESPLPSNDTREIANFIHGLGLGLKVLTIPYYDEWNEASYHSLGVDYVMGQPNFAWTGNTSAFSVVEKAIQEGNLDGAEFELADNYLNLSREENANYYINNGIRYGWKENRINSYYYAPGILDNITTMSDRRIYDRIYQTYNSYHSKPGLLTGL
jgi:hypothetical protein